MSDCRTYWGSHGCDLPQGHPDSAVRHQCGGGPEDEDGPCSQVTWELDPLTATEHWVWRFADGEGGWDAQAFPATLFGEDVPEGTGGTWDEEQHVRQVWTDAGKLARYDRDRGWVYEAKEASGGS